MSAHDPYQNPNNDPGLAMGNQISKMFTEIRRATQNPAHWDLGSIKDALRQCDPDLPVLLHVSDVLLPPRAPHPFASWRGVYAELSIVPDGKATSTMTVKEFLAQADFITGRELTGYKGGEWPMDDDTVVWVSPWGEVWHQAVTGVILAERDIEGSPVQAVFIQSTEFED